MLFPDIDPVFAHDLRGNASYIGSDRKEDAARFRESTNDTQCGYGVWDVLQDIAEEDYVKRFRWPVHIFQPAAVDAVRANGLFGHSGAALGQLYAVGFVHSLPRQLEKEAIRAA